MDEDLKSYLGAMKSELRGDIERVETNLRGDSGSLRAGIERVETNIEHVETTLRAEIESVETNLLTEFRKWGRTSDMRTRQALADYGGSERAAHGCWRPHLSSRTKKSVVNRHFNPS